MYKLRNYLVAGAGSVLLVLALLSVNLRYVSADEKDKFSAPNPLQVAMREKIRLSELALQDLRNLSTRSASKGSEDVSDPKKIALQCVQETAKARETELWGRFRQAASTRHLWHRQLQVK